MTSISERTREFHVECAKEIEYVYDSYDNNDLLQYTLIQLTDKLFQLEDRIKELENVRV